MTLPPEAPRSICLLRLSALGDVTHVLPLVHTLRSAWPEVALTWVIGTGEHRLLQGLPGVEFLVYDKKSGLAGMRALRRELHGRRFDALLQMQVAARANLLSAFLPARRRIGYDRSRSKDLHGLFVRERIPDRPGIHVLDAIGSFCEPLGLRQRTVRWDLPVPGEAHDWARAQWPEDGTPALVISPCSSHVRRNWYPDRYAAVADHAAPGLAGGPVRRAQRWARDRRRHPRRHAPAGAGPGRQDTLKQLRPARPRRPGDDPDSGPMHIANAMGEGAGPAASNPGAAAVLDRRYCVDPTTPRRALLRRRGRAQVGHQIEYDGVMELVTVDDAVAAFGLRPRLSGATRRRRAIGRTSPRRRTSPAPD